jgi:hypothetical protein
MHNSPGMHMFQSEQQTSNCRLNLLWCKLMLSLDLIIQLTTLQQLHTDIYRILRFIHLKKRHKILMVESPHQLNFIDQRLFAFVLSIGCLLRKRLNSELFVVLKADGEVNRSKIPFTNFFDRLEKLVKTPLIESGR